MTDDEFLALEPPATMRALAGIPDAVEAARLRSLYAARRGKLVDGTGDPARLRDPAIKVTGAFKDAPRVAFAARSVVVATLALAAVTLALRVVEYLPTLPRADDSRPADMAATTNVLALMVVLHTVMMIVCAAVVLPWLYRANANAHRLGVRKLRFSPGWSVGCYFVPFVAYAVPFLAMRDLWEASVDPADRDDRGSWQLPVWWGAWIIYEIGSYLAGRMETFSGAIGPTPLVLGMISDLAFVVAGALFVRMLWQIQRGQKALYSGVAQAEVFA